ncbi:MAG TPA: hypothetical protein VIG53_00585 [Actinomycetota bacterium]
MSGRGVNAMPGRPEGEMVPHANEDELRQAAQRHEVHERQKEVRTPWWRRFRAKHRPEV